MTAQEIKKAMVHYLLWERGARAVAHEYSTGLSKCDMFSVNRLLFSTEYEIKVSKPDLMMEIKIIKRTLQELNPQLFRGSLPYSKSEKHIRYLGKGQPTSYKLFIPNHFYFVVTSELSHEAIEGVQETPYGVIEINQNMGNAPKVVRRAAKIHANKMDIEDMVDLCRKLCWVAYNAGVDPNQRIIK